MNARSLWWPTRRTCCPSKDLHSPVMAFLSLCSNLLHLVLQVECADFVVANKTDMLPKQEQLDQLIAIISSLNPLATVMPCQNGKVSASRAQRCACFATTLLRVWRGGCCVVELFITLITHQQSCRLGTMGLVLFCMLSAAQSVMHWQGPTASAAAATAMNPALLAAHTFCCHGRHCTASPAVADPH